MALQVNKVLISDSVDTSCREILETAGVSVDYKPGLSKEDLLQCIKVRQEHTLSDMVVAQQHKVFSVHTC